MLGFSKIQTTQAQYTTLAAVAGVANPAGSGAGASVTVAVSFVDQYGVGQLPQGSTPQSYAVHVTPNQAGVIAAATNKTSSGFNVVLTPLSGTLPAGSFDAIVVG
jgi:hypothetical protein